MRFCYYKLLFGMKATRTSSVHALVERILTITNPNSELFFDISFVCFATRLPFQIASFSKSQGEIYINSGNVGKFST